MALAEPQSDVAVLWEEALDNYKIVTDVDMRARLTTQRSVTSIMMDQQRQLENFAVFRHDKGKLDRFRTLITSNADIIQTVAVHIADAASVAFPPSSAILTAFTFVMTASKHVSDDYDMIEGFFGIMQSFLQRLSLLEDKIPPHRAFQTFLMNVFSSLLKLSAIARAYCAKGRFSKWAKALVDGKDPDLTAAYEKLKGNLQELESAIIMQTLRTTIKISEETKSTNQNVKVLQGQLDRNTALTMKTLETSEQTLMVTLRTDTGMQELLLSSRDSVTTSNELLRRQDNMIKKLDEMQSKDNKDKQRNLKSGASRPVNFERLKIDFLNNSAEGVLAEKLTDMKLSYCDRLFEWIEKDVAFGNVINEEESLLWVSGAPGMGKSTLSYRMLRSLEERYSFDTTTCVAWFSFDEEHAGMRSVGNMLRCCSIRAAEKDPRYCCETLAALRRESLLTDEDAWTHLIESRYTKDSRRRLIIVLDGIDEIDEEDFPKLIKFLDRIRTQQCAIQAIFTCDPDKEQDVSVLEAKRIELTRNKIIRDMRMFAWSRIKTLSRLRKLRITLRKTIVRKIMRKADSFLYIDHTIRRLNALGREGPILKELDNLSENTTAIYHTLLEECQKNRTPEDRELLRSLLAWLAYMKTKLTVAEANVLIEIIQKENAISIEEELDGRLSRLLRISGDRADDEDDSSETDDNTENVSDEDVETERNTEDANNFLSFQERSLKAYFRHAIQDQPDGLRCTATEAQTIIFRTCSTILTMPKKNTKNATQILVKYASDWGLSHLLEILPDEECSVSDDLAKVVIESIYNMFSNKNESLKPLEERAQGIGTVLSGEGISQEQVLATLSAWAKRALRLSPNQLSYGILDWFRPLAQEPLRIFIGLSRAHITNWFSSTYKLGAYFAFMSAHFALQEGRNLIELKQNPVLEEYFEHYLQSDLKITERSFEVVAGCLWDIVKTSSSYKGIGMAMQWVGLYNPAVKQLNKGLNDFTIDAFEQFLLLTNKGETLLSLAKEEIGKEQKTQYMEESLQTLIQANELYHRLEEVSQDDEELRQLASFNFGSTAHAAALLGKTDLVLRSITNGLGTKASLPPATLNDVVSALKNVDQLLTIIDLLKLVPKSDITWYLVAESVEASQEAAVRTGQGQYLLDLYDAAQKVISAWPFGTEDFKARLQSNAAIFARQALGNLDVAKTLLHDMVNHPRTPTWRILEACNMLAEIYLEEFRLSKDPLVKKNALDETMKLFEKPAEVLPDSYNAAESHMIVTVALMLRRFGPALDLSDRLHAAFRNCIGELQDETGANDAYALRRLARVLSCLPGFEREARISLSAQLYVIDEDVHRKDLEQLQTAEKNEVQASAIEGKEVINGIDAKDDLAVECDDQVAADSIGAPANNNMNQRAPFVDNASGSTNGFGTADSNTEAITENTARSPAVLNEIDEGLLSDSEFYCNFCIKETRDWSHGPTFLCIYCIDVDICEECFAKKIAREKGELEPDWRVICPQGHKHVKAPIEGWRGVRNGIMRIETEEIPFKTWLVQLEVKWTKYWEEFWTEAETM